MGDFANSPNTDNMKDPKNLNTIGNSTNDLDTSTNSVLSYKDAYATTDTANMTPSDPNTTQQPSTQQEDRQESTQEKDMQKKQMYASLHKELPGYFIKPKETETAPQESATPPMQESQLNTETITEQDTSEVMTPVENESNEETIETIASVEVGEKPKQPLQEPTQPTQESTKELPENQTSVTNVVDLTTKEVHTTPLKETIDTITAYADKEEEEFIENVKTAHASQ